MDIYEFLESGNIEYVRYDHPPVYTCEEADKLTPDMPGEKIKNLFICDDKGKNHFLVVVGHEKTVDLKELAKHLEVKKLRFASPDRLKKYLNLDPGAVTPLAVINDDAKAVNLVLDIKLWEAEGIQCHPLVNTSTLYIACDHFRRFLDKAGYEPKIIDVPERA